MSGKSFIITKKSILVMKGFVQAMNGEELWINTETDEMITVVIKDKKTRNRLYCKNVTVQITIEE